MFLGSDMGDWMVVAFLFVLVVILAAWAIMTEKENRRRRAKIRQKTVSAENHDERTRNPKYVEPMDDWEFPENDSWEYPYASGQFVKSWYLDMDVVEEGITELGSRYRILKDNETGVLYFYDRAGMTPLVKDYSKVRYA